MPSVGAGGKEGRVDGMVLIARECLAQDYECRGIAERPRLLDVMRLAIVHQDQQVPGEGDR
jgi:hypothetical protein